MSVLELGFACIGLLALTLASEAGAAEIKYGVGSWPEAMGNHRAVVRVGENAASVRAHVEWRRHDANPQDKAVIVVDAETGNLIDNATVFGFNRVSGDVVFEPKTAPGDYYIYYMPYKHIGEAYQGKVVYDPPKDTADKAWLAGVKDKWQSLPAAEVVEMQARGEFHRFDPMEVIASEQEVTDIMKRNPLRSYMLFPEDRRYPIKMNDFLPQRWVQIGPKAEFHGEAQRGEYYPFQVGVYAARAAIEDVAVACSDLVSTGGGMIPASGARCMNVLGRDWLGRAAKRPFPVAMGKVRPLWFGIQVPSDVPAGAYSGMVSVKPKGSPETQIRVTLKVSDPVLTDAGDSDLLRLSRLRWLDSQIGLEDVVPAPYTRVKTRDNFVYMLGREIGFGAAGLPVSIKSGGAQILARPVSLTLQTANAELRFEGGKGDPTDQVNGSGAARTSSSGQGGFEVKCLSDTQFDGHTNFLVTIKAKKAAQLKDVRFEIPIRAEIAKYMMGLGCKGGNRPKEWQWQWDKARANNMLWIGDVNAGLYCKLKLPADPWDLYAPSELPKSWANDGKGGCDVVEQDNAVVVKAYSGERAMKAGEEIEFRFALLITPVKPLHPKHWDERYYHFYKEIPKPADIAQTGAKIVNIHQGNDLNPNINYPFVQATKLTDYVKQIHDLGLKAKIYYTARELSNFVAEMWPLRSLGDEIFVKGNGGGDAWLIEHMGTNYAPAWHDPLSDGSIDAAIHTTGLSRWHNYYLEGLSWLIKSVGIDGLYLDGIGYDREIMKRVRRVMDQAKPGCLIDFHSGNNYTYEDHRVSAAAQYMEHFPYIDSLWFGEGYDPNETPDYWLIEMSGIPFGLYGEMLQGGGNPWRGMLYGMTNRLGWQGDPKAIWKVWDDFGIKDSKMIGYWDPACPVQTGNKDILATVYSKQGKALISIASWAKEPAKVKLTLDWKALGIDIRKADLRAPAVPGFQEAMDFQWSGDVPVEPGKGWLLVLEEK